MNYAIIKNGLVVNIVVSEYPKDDSWVLCEGLPAFIGGVYDGQFHPIVEPPPIITNLVPQAVTMRQARLALDAAGLLPAVQAAINVASSASKITWEYSSEVQRHNGLVPQMAQALGMTEEQIDNLFIMAGTL